MTVTTRKQTMHNLAARVEEGKDETVCDALLSLNSVLGVKWGMLAYDAFNGNIQYAERLHKMLLHDWVVSSVEQEDPRYRENWEVVLRNQELLAKGEAMCFARAWLSAILRALALEGEE